LFADHFEPDATFVLHVTPGAASGTLLAECFDDAKSLQIEVEAAELLLSKGAGPWDFDEFKAKVVGKAPVLVLVETNAWRPCLEWKGNVCGGFAAVPFEVRTGWNGEWAADPTGESFVFSLRPTAARYSLEDKSKALCIPRGEIDLFAFGDCCLGIYDDDLVARYRWTHAVPAGWQSGGSVEFARFEVWRVAL
jgi:hypothetical protein